MPKIWRHTGAGGSDLTKKLKMNLFGLQDPLLLVPRNDGACLWAPSVPYSTVPACTVNTSSFSCHLHTNGAFTLERSKSDVQAHRHLKAEYSKKTTFYTEQHTKQSKSSSDKVFGLERSKTSAILPGSMQLDGSIFDNRPAYSRAAPSPPVRMKLSPASRRVERETEVRLLQQQGRLLGSTGILDEAPIPPRRKLSPKNLDNNETSDSRDNINNTEDLIKL